jgi:hypothetical protein
LSPSSRFGQDAQREALNEAQAQLHNSYMFLNECIS